MPRSGGRSKKQLTSGSSGGRGGPPSNARTPVPYALIVFFFLSRKAVNVFGRFMRRRARRPALHRAGPHSHGGGGRGNFRRQCGDRELDFLFSLLQKSWLVPNHVYLACTYCCTCSDSWCMYSSPHDLRAHARSKIPFECRRHCCVFID